MRQAWWLLRKLVLMAWVCARLSIYCLFRPKALGAIYIPILSAINEFYTLTHGRLRTFKESRFYRDLTDQYVFSTANMYNADSKVTRPIESLVLSTLTQALNPQTIFEIGTFKGYTTLNFAKNTAEDCQIYTLDLPPDFNVTGGGRQFSDDDLRLAQASIEGMFRREYTDYADAKKITDLFGDSRTFDYSSYDGKIDLVLVDANHALDSVKSDTEAALSMLSDKGVIIWHDYDYIIHRDVFLYLNQFAKELKIYFIPNTRFAIFMSPSLDNPAQIACINPLSYGAGRDGVG